MEQKCGVKVVVVFINLGLTSRSLFGNILIRLLTRSTFNKSSETQENHIKSRILRDLRRTSYGERAAGGVVVKYSTYSFAARWASKASRLSICADNHVVLCMNEEGSKEERFLRSACCVVILWRRLID